MPGAGGDGEGPVTGGELLVGDEWDFHGGGAADDFGENADHVVEVADGAEAAVPPGGVAGAGTHGGAAEALGHKAGVHGGTDLFDTERDEGIEVVVEGVAEGGDENDGAGGAGLVVVVDDAGEPLDGHLAIHVGGFDLAGEEEVAVVVVPDVLLVEPGEIRHAALEGIFFAHVPVGDEFLAVGVGEDAEDDVVVEDAESFGVVAADELVDGLHQLLGADGFGGVEAAVDPDHGFAGLGDVMGLGLGDAFGEGEAPGDVLILL